MFSIYCYSTGTLSREFVYRELQYEVKSSHINKSEAKLIAWILTVLNVWRFITNTPSFFFFFSAVASTAFFSRMIQLPEILVLDLGGQWRQNWIIWIRKFISTPVDINFRIHMIQFWRHWPPRSRTRISGSWIILLKKAVDATAENFR